MGGLEKRCFEPLTPYYSAAVAVAAAAVDIVAAVVDIVAVVVAVATLPNSFHSQ